MPMDIFAPTAADRVASMILALISGWSHQVDRMGCCNISPIIPKPKPKAMSCVPSAISARQAFSWSPTNILLAMESKVQEKSSAGTIINSGIIINDEPAKSPFQKIAIQYRVMLASKMHYMMMQARTPALQKRLFAESSLILEHIVAFPLTKSLNFH